MWLEIDALILVDLLKSDQLRNAELFYLLKDTTTILSSFTYKVSHILLEGTACADFLANLGASSSSLQKFVNQNLPLEL